MLMLLRTLLSHYRRHPVQAVFLVTGIVVANVLLVGTLLINAQARASYDRGETLLRAGPVGQVRHRDPGRTFDERVYLQLRRQGFDMLAPVLRRVVRTAGGEPLELVGIDLFAIPRAGRAAQGESRTGERGNDPGFVDFAFPPFQLWAAPARLQQLGLAAGSRPQLASGERLPPLVPVAGQELGHRLLIDIGALQTITGSAGELSSMLVFAAPPQRLAQLRDALPVGLAFHATEEAPDPAELTRSFHLNLAAMGLLTFVVGVFLTYNALAFSYTDRRELIRKLRLSGATRRELTGALLAELALFLLAGALLGLYGVYIAYPDGLVGSGFLLPLLMTGIAATLCVLFPLREALNTPLLERWQAGWQLQTAARRDRVLLGAGLLLLLCAAAIGFSARSLWAALAGMACLAAVCPATAGAAPPRAAGLADCRQPLAAGTRLTGAHGPDPGAGRQQRAQHDDRKLPAGDGRLAGAAPGGAAVPARRLAAGRAGRVAGRRRRAPARGRPLPDLGRPPNAGRQDRSRRGGQPAGRRTLPGQRYADRVRAPGAGTVRHGGGRLRQRAGLAAGRLAARRHAGPVR
jgi:putative ABC transport system permease protein